MSLQGERAAFKERDRVLSIIYRLREKAVFSQCPIVLIPECAPSISASNIHKHVLDAKVRETMEGKNAMGHCTIMRERTKEGDAEGVPKTEEIGYRYKDEILWSLQSNTLRISSDLIVEYAKDESGNLEYDEEFILDYLGQMMKNYRLQPRGKSSEERSGVSPTSKYVLTAKVNGLSDDLFVSLMMAIYWRRIFLSSPKYINEVSLMPKLRF